MKNSTKRPLGHIVIEFLQDFKGDRFSAKRGSLWGYQISSEGPSMERLQTILAGKAFEFANSQCPGTHVQIIGWFLSPFDSEDFQAGKIDAAHELNLINNSKLWNELRDLATNYKIQ